jgi:hypothetical protein
MIKVCFIPAVAFLALVGSTALTHAQPAAPVSEATTVDPATAAEPPAVPVVPAAPPEGPKKTLSGNHLAGFAGVSNQPFVVPVVVIDSFIGGLGISAHHDANGLADPATGVPGDDKLALALYPYLSYMIVNKFPFAMGPELGAVVSMAPGDVGDPTVVLPGWTFWFRPFDPKVKIGFGFAWDISISMAKGRDPVIDLVTPGLRFGWLIN